MKHYAPYLLLLLMAVFSFCKKEQVPQPPDPVEPPAPIIELGRIAYDRNGARINYLGSAYKDDNRCGISTKERVIAGSSLVEKLALASFPLKVGVYKLEPTTQTISALLSFLVQDEIRAGFESKGQPDDLLEIIEYDAVKQTIQGKFNVTVVNYYGNDVSVYGQKDTIRFTNGVFHFKVQ